jgi:hypothetical protein
VPVPQQLRDHPSAVDRPDVEHAGVAAVMKRQLRISRLMRVNA